MKTSRIVLIIIFALAIFLFIGWVRLPDMISNSLSRKMQVSVEIDDISLRPSLIGIHKLNIASPKGYTLPKSLSVDTLEIHAPLLRYFDQNVVIEEIDLQKVYLGLEFNKKGSKNGNWSLIMENYQESTNAGVKKEKTEKSVLIKKLVLNNISVDLAYKDTGSVQHLKPIKRLEFTNVTSEGGIPTDQISNLIMQQMLKEVFSQENLQNMIEGFLQSPEQGVQNLLSPFKSLMP
ncbi:MAG: AsmA family protein [Chlamydiota bacterium]